MQKEFNYVFNEGPLDSEVDLAGDWRSGNCRRAVQYYIWKEKGIFLKPERVLCPLGYNETGSFVFANDQKFSFETLEKGDIIYAEMIRNKHSESVDRGMATFPTKDDYIISLHTALFTKEQDSEIWHATAVEGKSCYWSKERFLNYYRPVNAKRI